MTKTEALKLLGLSNKYTLADVKKAYRVLAKKYHPDLVGEKYSKMFADINEANNYLMKLGEPKSCRLTHENIFDIRLN